MPTTRGALLNRITSLCAATPFQFVRALTPFDFDLQPTGQIDQVFRVEVESPGTVLGGLNYSEDRTDTFTIWVARKQNAAPHVTYGLLVDDVTSLTAAIVRDGATAGGDYAVPDGGGVSFQHDNGREFAMARLALPINYEVQL